MTIVNRSLSAHRISPFLAEQVAVHCPPRSFHCGNSECRMKADCDVLPGNPSNLMGEATSRRSDVKKSRFTEERSLRFCGSRRHRPCASRLWSDTISPPGVRHGFAQRLRSRRDHGVDVRRSHSAPQGGGDFSHGVIREADPGAHRGDANDRLGAQVLPLTAETWNVSKQNGNGNKSRSFPCRGRDEYAVGARLAAKRHSEDTDP